MLEDVDVFELLDARPTRRIKLLLRSVDFDKPAVLRLRRRCVLGDGDGVFKLFEARVAHLPMARTAIADSSLHVKCRAVPRNVGQLDEHELIVLVFLD